MDRMNCSDDDLMDSSTWGKNGKSIREDHADEVADIDQDLSKNCDSSVEPLVKEDIKSSNALTQHRSSSMKTLAINNRIESDGIALDSATNEYCRNPNDSLSIDSYHYIIASRISGAKSEAYGFI